MITPILRFIFGVQRCQRLRPKHGVSFSSSLAWKHAQINRNRKPQRCSNVLIWLRALVSSVLPLAISRRALTSYTSCTCIPYASLTRQRKIRPQSRIVHRRYKWNRDFSIMMVIKYNMEPKLERAAARRFIKTCCNAEIK